MRSEFVTILQFILRQRKSGEKSSKNNNEIGNAIGAKFHVNVHNR